MRDDHNRMMTTDDRLAALVDETDQVRRWERLRAFVTSEPSVARVIGEHGLTSDDPRTREVAADVLGSVASVDRPSAAATADVLIRRLEVEQDAGVLDSVITALGHACDSRARAGVLKHAEHPDENVRFAVAWSLPALDLDDDSLAVDTRAEGIFGLARRHDPRARPLIEHELSRPVHSALIERALEELEA